MNNDFIIGFVKAAMQCGFTQEEALEVYKQSDDRDESNFMQRYQSTQSLRNSVNANHPFTGLMHGHETNKKNIDQAAEDTSKGYGDNAARFAKGYGQVGATVGGGIGAFSGGTEGHAHPTHGGAKGALLGTLLGALGGAGIGGGIGAAGGALSGLAHKYHAESTTNLPSRNDAKERLKAHPIRQSLIPFGDVFASMGKAKQPQG